MESLNTLYYILTIQASRHRSRQEILENNVLQC